ncbi:MAG: hypothetical protein D6731_21555 [Planctomycetota bacterium]|nr:MAG: hypothetical protein D6731_21555 [Planctomycetota bacterium]
MSTEDSSPPRRLRIRRLRCCGALALLGAVALAWGYPLLIPLLNPSTHPWRAKKLFTEIAPRRAWRFAGYLDEFLLYDLVEADPAEHRGRSLAELRERVLARQEALRRKALAVAERAGSGDDAPDAEALRRAARTLLRLGAIDEARTALRAAVEARGGPERAPRALVQALAETSLRAAETRNCVGHHSPESCLYPLRGRAVHVEPGPANEALSLYEVLLRRFPQERPYRWLRALCAQVLGRADPASPVPARGRAPFVRLEDVAQAAGLFRPTAPRAGAGAILDDFDGDGHLDLILGSYLPDDPLLYYRGRGDGTFEERSEEAGLAGELGAFRLNQADVDNDGDLDVFVVRGGWVFPGRNTLLLNDGHGRFRDATAEAGLAEPIEQSMAGAWGDYDGDGWIDLFVCNLAPPFERSRLYRNQGDGTFAEVTESVGLPPLLLCSSACWGDYDDDGDVDLYVSVAFGQNYLFRNEGGERFLDVTWEAGVARPLTSFPAWFFDADDDGRLDIFCGTFWPLLDDELANLLSEAPPAEVGLLRLHRNQGNGRFVDATHGSGLDVVVSTMGAGFGDLDSDGRLDIHLGTGSPYLAHLVPNRLFRGVGAARFEEVTFSAGVGHLQKGHGTCFGDVDEDGDVDLLVNLGGAVPVDRFQPALFRNPGQGNHWLELRLEGTRSNRAAIGARVFATLPDGRRLHRQVSSGGPFGASPLRLHLGLGSAERVARLEVRWPSGTRQVLEDLPADRRLTLREPR